MGYIHTTTGTNQFSVPLPSLHINGINFEGEEIKPHEELFGMKEDEIYKKYLLRNGIDFVEIYHFPYGHNKIVDRVCFCRKLYLGMILRAAKFIKMNYLISKWWEIKLLI